MAVVLEGAVPRFTERLVVCPPRGSEVFRPLEAALVRGEAAQVRYRPDVPATPGGHGPTAPARAFGDAAALAWRTTAAPPCPVAVAAQLRSDVSVTSPDAGPAGSTGTTGRRR